MAIVEETFFNVKNPRAEVERGFRFWDSVGSRRHILLDCRLTRRHPRDSSCTPSSRSPRTRVRSRRSSTWSCRPT